jgi:integrase
VPLSLGAKAILATQDQARDTLFRKVSVVRVQHWVRDWCVRQAIAPSWTPHDLRRTARTLLSRVGVAPHVAELALNHSLGKLLHTYDRHDFAAELRNAFDRLGVEVERIVRP